MVGTLRSAPGQCLSAPIAPLSVLIVRRSAAGVSGSVMLFVRFPRKGIDSLSAVMSCFLPGMTSPIAMSRPAELHRNAALAVVVPTLPEYALSFDSGSAGASILNSVTSKLITWPSASTTSSSGLPPISSATATAVGMLFTSVSSSRITARCRDTVLWSTPNLLMSISCGTPLLVAYSSIRGMCAGSMLLRFPLHPALCLSTSPRTIGAPRFPRSPSLTQATM